jgi:multidrug resistance efflux pump
MRDPKFYVILLVAAVVVDLSVTWLMLRAYTSWTQGATVTYNCEVSEISPDIPPKVRQQCRELRRANP